MNRLHLLSDELLSGWPKPGEVFDLNDTVGQIKRGEYKIYPNVSELIKELEEER